MQDWHLHEDYRSINDFSSLDKIFSLSGEIITQDSISDLIKLERQGTYYYVKRYYTAGKGLKAYRPRPRIRAEWESLQFFAQWQVPTEKLIVYGMQKRLGRFVRGAIITQEILRCEDLSRLAAKESPLLKNRAALNLILQQLAESVRKLHQHRFVHRDLHWRNCLVDDSPQVHIIDCPKGRFLWGPFLEYYKMRDLAYLDRNARPYLSKSQRLYFFKRYQAVQTLNAHDKKLIRRIVQFRSKHGKR